MERGVVVVVVFFSYFFFFLSFFSFGWGWRRCWDWTGAAYTWPEVGSWEWNGKFAWFNPFTATACKFSGLKSSRLQTVYLMVRQQTYFQYRALWQKSFHGAHAKGEETLMILNLALFYWSFSEWRRGKHGSEKVKQFLITSLLNAFLSPDCLR